MQCQLLLCIANGVKQEWLFTLNSANRKHKAVYQMGSYSKVLQKVSTVFYMV